MTGRGKRGTLRVLERVATAVVVVAFLLLNIRDWIDGRYLRAFIPWAAVAGLATGWVIVVCWNLRRERQEKTTDPENNST